MLSTTRKAREGAEWATSAITRMSVIFMVGLLGVSTQICIKGETERECRKWVGKVCEKALSKMCGEKKGLRDSGDRCADKRTVPAVRHTLVLKKVLSIILISLERKEGEISKSITKQKVC